MRFVRSIGCCIALLIFSEKIRAETSPLKPLDQLKSEMWVFRVKREKPVLTLPGKEENDVLILVGGDGLSDGVVQNSYNSHLRFECAGKELPISEENKNMFVIRFDNGDDLAACLGQTLYYKLDSYGKMECFETEGPKHPLNEPFIPYVTDVKSVRRRCEDGRPTDSGLKFPTKKEFEKMPVLSEEQYYNEYIDFIIHINPEMKDFYDRLRKSSEKSPEQRRKEWYENRKQKSK